MMLTTAKRILFLLSISLWIIQLTSALVATGEPALASAVDYPECILNSVLNVTCVKQLTDIEARQTFNEKCTTGATCDRNEDSRMFGLCEPEDDFVHGEFADEIDAVLSCEQSVIKTIGKLKA